MKILIADDNSTMRTLITNILEHWGYEAILAVDADEAWHILEQEDSLRVAILDWGMPGKDGLELCRYVRAQETDRARYMYIILLTARSEQSDIVAGMQAGADDYVVKPFNPSELHVRVRAGQRIVKLQSELFQMKEEFRRLSRPINLSSENSQIPSFFL